MNKTLLAAAIAQEVRRAMHVLCAASIMMLPVYSLSEETTDEQGNADESAPQQLKTLRIQGTRLNRYQFDEANSATGFNIDVDELPRSVQVLPEQIIQDQKADTLEDVLQNVAAITRAHGFGGTESQVNIRGFANSYLFVDGNPVSNRFNVDVATIERVEVILGPASVLHGQVSPGGLINIVTKKPQAERANNVQLDLDQYGQRKISADSTGSVTDSIQYRVIIAREDSDSFREVQTEDGKTSATRETLTIAPSISFTPNLDNTITLSYLYSEQSLPIDRGSVAVADENGDISIADIPVERRLGSKYDDRDSTEHKIQLDFDHTFMSGWKNKLKTGYYQKEFEDYQARPYRGLSDSWTGGTGTVDLSDLATLSSFTNSLQGSSVQSNGLLVRTADSNLDVTESNMFVSNSLSGDYRIAGIQNTLYFGGNINQRKVDHSDGFALQDISNIFGAGVYAPVFDVIDIYSDSNPSYSKADQTVVSKNSAEYLEIGLSLQNMAQLTDRLNLLTGVRYDRFEIDRNDTIYYQQQDNGTFVKLEDPEKVKLSGSNENFSGQAGLMYDLTKTVSVYGSWAESFTPNYPDVTAGQVTGDDNMDPEEATQYEVGIKSSLLDDKLRLGLSLYQLERYHVMTFENLEARLNGKEETKGLELTSTMQFVPGLNVLASYTKIDSEIVDDNDDSVDREGNRPYGVPTDKLRLWGSYEFQNGRFKSLGFGLGMEYVSDRYGDDDNSFKLPAYTVFDMSSWYHIPFGKDDQLRIQAGVKNLTDETYYTANLGNAYRINVGSPRTFYVSASVDF
ncbi:TonB-dependent siderophore receptor [Gynuella sunshinyii]|uniref:Outer membrane receptor for monomeric catechol n=1 Tax=Gynuella sunshinyii YC6258 TaxID=1445510 RepID=A0A0C5VYT1_9GAMM|nr:TonB-dependent siderophore receptor [Gynuella sunshinyii]AJQ95569.1 outer membrane receptor for monomeric catechol [Gynuella sunshinyii YC6258]